MTTERPEKRSLTIEGHRTSISLETEFWTELSTLAIDRNQTVSELVSDIDKQRKDGGLSSAIRVFILRHYKQKSGTATLEEDQDQPR